MPSCLHWACPLLPPPSTLSLWLLVHHSAASSSWRKLYQEHPVSWLRLNQPLLLCNIIVILWVLWNIISMVLVLLFVQKFFDGEVGLRAFMKPCFMPWWPSVFQLLQHAFASGPCHWHGSLSHCWSSTSPQMPNRCSCTQKSNYRL